MLLGLGFFGNFGETAFFALNRQINHLAFIGRFYCAVDFAAVGAFRFPGLLALGQFFLIVPLHLGCGRAKMNSGYLLHPLILKRFLRDTRLVSGLLQCRVDMRRPTRPHLPDLFLARGVAQFRLGLAVKFKLRFAAEPVLANRPRRLQKMHMPVAPVAFFIRRMDGRIHARAVPRHHPPRKIPYQSFALLVRQFVGQRPDRIAGNRCGFFCMRRPWFSPKLPRRSIALNDTDAAPLHSAARARQWG